MKPQMQTGVGDNTHLKIEDKQEDIVSFKIENGFVDIPLKDILFIRPYFNYARIFRSKDDFEPVYLNLLAIEKMLPPTQFMRVNRSAIINLKYLTDVNREELICTLKKDGVTYPFKVAVTRRRLLDRL